MWYISKDLISEVRIYVINCSGESGGKIKLGSNEQQSRARGLNDAEYLYTSSDLVRHILFP